MKRLTSFTYSFEKLRNGGCLYVDKTESIWKLIRPTQEGYFLSRPRRFGKSLTVSTLKAIFEGRRELELSRAEGNTEQLEQTRSGMCRGPPYSFECDRALRDVPGAHSYTVFR